MVKNNIYKTEKGPQNHILQLEIKCLVVITQTFAINLKQCQCILGHSFKGKQVYEQM